MLYKPLESQNRIFVPLSSRQSYFSWMKIIKFIKLTIAKQMMTLFIDNGSA